MHNSNLEQLPGKIFQIHCWLLFSPILEGETRHPAHAIILTLTLLELNMKDTLEALIGASLRKRGLKLAVAESCTGGLVSHLITNVPGSSDYFLGGVVAYAYEAKVALLHVSWDTLNLRGAVSKETAIEMARGVRTALGSDIGLSVSGIAGPGGELPDKPVGTTWIGLSARNGDWARLFTWKGDRISNKEASAQAALRFVLDYLENNLDNG